MKRTFFKAFLWVPMMLIGFSASAIEKADDVYLIGSMEDMAEFCQMVNLGQCDINGRLTADIDGYTAENMLLRYDGVLDGDGHTLTVDMEFYEAFSGPVKVLYGEVRNLVVKGQIVSTKNIIAGIAAELHGAIRNCVVMADIEGDFIDWGGCHGGITAYTYEGSIVENCVFAGSMYGLSGYSAGIVGAAIGETFVTNCLQIGSCYMSTEGAATIGRNACTIVNCYYKEPFGEINPNSVQVTDEELESGYICYRLNGDQSDIVWTQTLGTDPFPYPFPTHKTVYAKGNITCIGTSADGSAVIYDNVGPSSPAKHQYENGTCIHCGEMQEDFLEVVDGYYQISNLAQYEAFVSLVNGGNNTINGRLTADIDGVTGMMNIFKGVLDGGFHTITYDINGDVFFVGLIQHLYGTVENLIVDGYMSSSNADMGGIVGELVGGTVRNCVVYSTITSDFLGWACTHGSVAGYMQAGTIENCVFAGKMSGMSFGAGGIGGGAVGKINVRNCLQIGDISMNPDGSSTISRGGTYIALSNSYYLTPFGAVESGAKQITEEQLANGEVCFLLNNGNVENPTWTQNIGEDLFPYPSTDRGIVFCISEGNYISVQKDGSGLESLSSVAEIVAEKIADVVASAESKNAYLELIDAACASSDMESFLEAYNKLAEGKALLEESQKAYAAYISLVEEKRAWVEECELAGENVGNIRDYLTTYEEPDYFPNGSYEYIISSMELSTEGIQAEVEYLEQLFQLAISQDSPAGSDISLLLKNADFRQKAAGWEGTTGKATFTSNGEVVVVECVSTALDLSQTITGLKNGYYEFDLNALKIPRGCPGSRFYTAFLYANGKYVPIMESQEDPIAISDAVNMENCYCDNPGTWPYDAVYLEDYYLPSSSTGSYYAFKAGRYTNRIIVKVTDGTLTVGIAVHDGTGYSNDITWFNNARLTYLGHSPEEAVDVTLNQIKERAQAILLAEVSSDAANSIYFPNFSSDLRGQLIEALNSIEEAEILDDKYELIQTFSDLFVSIEDCENAYVSMLKKATQYRTAVDELYSGERMDEEAYEATSKIIDEVIAAYEEGTYSAEEARNVTFYSGVIKDGKYIISSMDELNQFVRLVNAGINDIDALLDADISEFTSEQVMNAYYGTFDGNFHKVTLNLVRDALYTGMFSNLYGTVKNLIVDGKLMVAKAYAGPICGNLYGNMLNCESYVDITSTFSGWAVYGGLAGAAGAGSLADNCLFAGTMIASETCGNAGIVGYAYANMTVRNCLNVGDMQVQDQASGPIIRATNNPTVENCYFKTAFGEFAKSFEQAVQVSDEQLASGEVCVLLNGAQENAPWFQTLTEDAYPVLQPNHKVVIKNEDGTYSNEGGSAIGIVTAEDTETPEAIFNMMGQKVEVTGRGLYIIGGKKVFVNE